MERRVEVSGNPGVDRDVRIGYYYPNIKPVMFYAHSISFEDAFRMINQGLIVRSLIEPELQQGGPNTIVNLYDANNQLYLVKARYDPLINKIFPPV